MEGSVVIKEFLAKLGFIVDKASKKEFDNSLEGIAKGSVAAGKGLAGAAVAVAAFVTAYSSSFEKMYYASVRTKESVRNLEAFSYAAKQIGIDADTADSAIEQLGQGLQNPIWKRWFEGITKVQTAGKTPVQIFIEAMKELSTLPVPIAESRAQAFFGMDQGTFLQWKDQLPDFIAKEKQHEELMKNNPAYTDDAAKASRDYMNSLRDLGDSAEHFGAILADKLLPNVRTITDDLNRMSVAILKDSQDQNGWLNNITTSLSEMMPILGAVIGMFVDLSAAIFNISTGNFSKLKQNLKDAYTEYADAVHLYLHPSQGIAAPDIAAPGSAGGGASPTASGSNPSALFSKLEQQWGLPSGLLDSEWRVESSRGTNTKQSSAGAMGQFQFLKETGARYGLNDSSDFNDLTKSATAAAHYLHDLIAQNNGSLVRAVATYGGSKKSYISNPDYVRNVLGGMNDARIGGNGGNTISASYKVEINANGGDSASTAKAVAGAQKSVLGEATRDLAQRMA